MAVIKTINFRKVLNSHVEFTNEFIVELADGGCGVGSSPQGETVGIYEDRNAAIAAEAIGSTLEEECLGEEMDQEKFDACLARHVGKFGRNNTFGLSLAFFNASTAGRPIFDVWNLPIRPMSAPRLCCNILNGGRHAYTNPVLSDFSEYLLVARSPQVEEVIQGHKEIQRRVREKLNQQPTEVRCGNRVHRFSTLDNRECLDFLVETRDELGLEKQFELMIDASAGDLWRDGGYRFGLTDNSHHSSEGLVEYWRKLIEEYEIRFLEDPFGEQDTASWQRLTAAADECCVIGDNFYSSDALRIEKGAASRCTRGVVIKPNQAGTVSAVRQAIEAAQRCGQIPITSHRSISTEETFLSTLTCMCGVEFMKIGPLFTDYSSVVRLNAILRLVGEHGGVATGSAVIQSAGSLSCNAASPERNYVTSAVPSGLGPDALLPSLEKAGLFSDVLPGQDADVR